MKILATSGGFIPGETSPFHRQRGPLIEHAIELAGSPERPRICHLATATGDNLVGVAGFYRAFAGSDVARFAPRAVHHAQRAQHARAPARSGRDLGRRRLGRQLARGLAGARPGRGHAGVLGGRRRARPASRRARSAGTWAAPPTLRPRAAAVTNGLALLPTATACTTTPRRSAGRCCTELVADGTLPTSYATDDGVGLSYDGTELVEAVADRPASRHTRSSAARRASGRDPHRAPAAARRRVTAPGTTGQIVIATFPRTSPASSRRMASGASVQRVGPVDARGDLAGLDELGEALEVAAALGGHDHAPAAGARTARAPGPGAAGPCHR